ncbi:TraR/DksA C4-type zinc finger protein [Alicyclobacillus contaminans]|uniref:TraR/DksA C4-type zinc finger protein n=1 Tax=Alicyclobacillus contaminans TaxID=392016 RepID=UPI000408EEA1|nr:TraR/DksA C4-type zinc finger protein [Alicyclobacillus contaminans]
MVEWRRQRARLEEARREVETRMSSSGQYGLDDAMSDELSELSLYDNHPADIGSELFERGKDLALRDVDKLRLQEIDRALQAIDRGTYGTCQRCGEQIPAERLEAYPLATLCVDCKRQDEREHPDRDRPVEEAFLTPGFARTRLDGTDNVAFDGEDSLQAVWRFNQRPDYDEDYEYLGQDNELDDNEGVVDDIDKVSNEEYKSQLR